MWPKEKTPEFPTNMYRLTTRIRALATAEPLGDLPLRAAAWAILALTEAFSGAIAEAERASAEAAALVDAMADDKLATRLDAMAYLSAAEAHIDCFEQGVDHGLRGLEVARATGRGQLLPMLIPPLPPRSSRAGGWPRVAGSLTAESSPPA